MAPNQAAPSSETAAERAMRIAVDIRRFPWIRRLAADYAYNFESVAPFFAGDPARPDAWRDAIRRAQHHVRRRGDVAALLADQQERRGAPPAAREAAKRLADPQTVAIVTGQQAGLFGGPLFTLLKALTALRLAEQVSREHGVPVVPIFWVDAEDHDWDEVRSCRVFDAELTPASVSLAARAGTESAPVATVCLDGSITSALDDLERILPPTEFRSDILADLRRAYAPDVGMAHAFARWLERVLGDRGLVVYESSDPAAKPMASPVFVRELSSPGETGRLAAAAGAELEKAGYHAQVQPGEDATSLFYLENGRRPIRFRMVRHDSDVDGPRLDAFVVGDERFDPVVFMRLATERPALFSPNVLLRPIVQDTLFPTICYVAGPNELAYLAQLGRVYERFGVPMPLFVPRMSATIVDSAALRFFNKYDVALETLQAQDDGALNQLLQSQIPAAVEDAFTSATRAVDSELARLIEAMPALDPTLEGAAKSTLGKMQHDLTTLHGKMIQAAKRRDETLRRQFTRTRALVFPDGHPQERAIGFVSFLNQYGPALIDRLADAVPLDSGHHAVVTV